jgi:hypothetical protein
MRKRYPPRACRPAWLLLALALALVTAGCGGPAAEPTAQPHNVLQATIDVEVFFTNASLGDPCGEAFPVTRTIDRDDPVRGLLGALLAGPTEAERTDGYGSWFDAATADALLDVEVIDGTAHVVFTDLRQLIPDASTSCGSAGLLAQLDTTLLALDDITATRYALADQTAFYAWLHVTDPDAPEPRPPADIEPPATAQPRPPADTDEPVEPGEPDDGTAASELTVARISDEIAAELASPYETPVEVEVSCDRSGPVRGGDVFVCEARSDQLPTTDWGGIVVAVVDRTTIAWSPGTDNPGSTDTLLDIYAEAPHGLACRDLLLPDAIGHPFNGAGTVPLTAYFWSVVYWNLEGQPARMDADGDGIPCETLYDADVISSVLREVTP